MLAASPVRQTRMLAWLACAYLPTFASASDATK
jgi:hypothetical protein